MPSERAKKTVSAYQTAEEEVDEFGAPRQVARKRTSISARIVTSIQVTMSEVEMETLVGLVASAPKNSPAQDAVAEEFRDAIRFAADER